MDFQAEYRSKLRTPAEAVRAVKNGDWVDYTSGLGFPPLLDAALAARRDELHDVKVRGNLCMGPLQIVECDPEQTHFLYHTWHCSAYERRLCDRGLCYFTPMIFRNLAWYYRAFLMVNVAMASVAPMDRHGYFSLALNGSYIDAMLDKTKRIFLEVNDRQPRGLCGSLIHISQVDAIVEYNHDLPVLPPVQLDEVSKTIGGLIAERIPDGACLQLGIGGMPNTIGSMIAQSDLKDLSVHTEMYVDGFVDMALAGKITGKHKNLDKGRQVFAFAAGTQKLYDYMDRNPDVMGAPVDYTNDVHVISMIDNFISINNAVDIDLFGQVNAESAGIKHISGAGGQLDFVLGAYLSNGGKSFICLSSTFMNKKTGKLESRIRPTLENGSIVTDTRANVHYLCTEYGCVNLKGLTSWEKAEALISVAHPDFRDELIAEAEKLHIWRRSNKR